MIMGLLGGMWAKVLIAGAIVLAILAVVLRIQVRATRAGRLEERAQQRKRNNAIKKLQDLEVLDRPDAGDLDAILKQL